MEPEDVSDAVSSNKKAGSRNWVSMVFVGIAVSVTTSVFSAYFNYLNINNELRKQNEYDALRIQEQYTQSQDLLKAQHQHALAQLQKQHELSNSLLMNQLDFENKKIQQQERFERERLNREAESADLARKIKALNNILDASSKADHKRRELQIYLITIVAASTSLREIQNYQLSEDVQKYIFDKYIDLGSQLFSTMSEAFLAGEELFRTIELAAYYFPDDVNERAKNVVSNLMLENSILKTITAENTIFIDMPRGDLEANIQRLTEILKKSSDEFSIILEHYYEHMDNYLAAVRKYIRAEHSKLLQ